MPRLHGHRPAANHHGRYQHMQLMMPLGPIESQQLLSTAEALEPWRREPVVLNARVAQPPVEAR
jgi:hypothetical protein